MVSSADALGASGWPSASTGVGSPGGVEPGLSQIEELRLADAERVHLVHLRLDVGRRLPAFALPGLLFGGEVQRHGVGALVVLDQHAADDIRAERRPVRGALPHKLTDTPRIVAAATDHLDKAGLV